MASLSASVLAWNASGPLGLSRSDLLAAIRDRQAGRSDPGAASGRQRTPHGCRADVGIREDSNNSAYGEHQNRKSASH